MRAKTTLIKALLDMSDDEVTKTGSVELKARNLKIAFFDQLRDQLDLEASVRKTSLKVQISSKRVVAKHTS